MWSVIKREIRKKGTNHESLINLVNKVYIYRFRLLFKDVLLDEMLDFLRFDNQ